MHPPVQSALRPLRTAGRIGPGTRPKSRPSKRMKVSLSSRRSNTAEKQGQGKAIDAESRAVLQLEESLHSVSILQQ